MVKVPNVDAAFERAKAKGLIAGLKLAKEYAELPDTLLLCATELHSKEKIDALVGALAGS